MTKEEFLAKYRYDLIGRILVAARERHDGAAFALWTRSVFEEVNVILQKMYFDLAPPPPKEPPK